jgi:hypothetical protein
MKQRSKERGGSAFLWSAFAAFGALVLTALMHELPAIKRYVRIKRM